MAQIDEPASKPPMRSIQEFFELVPPGTTVPISDLGEERGGRFIGHILQLPELNLHCTTEECNGIRFFETNTEVELQLDRARNAYVAYICKNCELYSKTFSLRVHLSPDGTTGQAYKYGEFPHFGPPTPSRLITLVGPEKDYFLRGRRAENMGLGIAAFAYYRRVIENQKNRILDEIIRVSEKVSAPKEIIEDLRAAKKEAHFSKAIDQIKHGIPQVLLINGHNPLTLLHGALSEGLHAQTDEQCLELATSIRVVLTDLVESMSQALKDEAVLNAALSRLLQAKKPGPN